MDRCYILGCGSEPKFLITALRSVRWYPYVAAAGPDANADESYACAMHVGELLDHQPDAPEPEAVYWEVHAI